MAKGDDGTQLGMFFLFAVGVLTLSGIGSSLRSQNEGTVSPGAVPEAEEALPDRRQLQELDEFLKAWRRQSEALPVAPLPVKDAPERAALFPSAFDQLPKPRSEAPLTTDPGTGQFLSDSEIDAE
ncbi:MAG: hypothetical protein AAF555_00085 [Verrucomicrobiota bacterium]